jgi:hypothetical protein
MWPDSSARLEDERLGSRGYRREMKTSSLLIDAILVRCEFPSIENYLEQIDLARLATVEHDGRNRVGIVGSGPFADSLEVFQVVTNGEFRLDDALVLGEVEGEVDLVDEVGRRKVVLQMDRARTSSCVGKFI